MKTPNVYRIRKWGKTISKLLNYFKIKLIVDLNKIYMSRNLVRKSSKTFISFQITEYITQLKSSFMNSFTFIFLRNSMKIRSRFFQIL